MRDEIDNPWLNAYFDRFRGGGFKWTPDRPLEVCFVMGYLGLTGGNTAILEHAKFLNSHGVLVTLIPTKGDLTEKPAWHEAFADLEITTVDAVKDRTFDVVIATWWETVYELPKLRFRHAAYFVQSIESRFYTAGTDVNAAARAELTYRFGIPIITVARWAEMYLALEHQAITFLVRNGIAKDRYHPEGNAVAARDGRRLRALVEGDIRLEMKGVPLAIDAARAAGFAEVWLMTTSDISEYEGVDRVFSKVPPDKTSEIYRSCDVLIKLSQVEGMFGPPLEMFHCGGTVVTWDVTGSEEYVVDGKNGLICTTGDTTALSDALSRIVNDPVLLDQLKAAALKSAHAWRDWEQSSRDFMNYLVGIASGVPIDRESLTLKILGAPEAIRLMQHAEA